MDVNTVEVRGRLVAPPELRVSDTGSHTIRVLVATRSEEPSRIDVVPATLVDPPCGDPLPRTGDRVVVEGRLQRRFRDHPDGRRSGIEVIAQRIGLEEGDCQDG